MLCEGKDQPVKLSFAGDHNFVHGFIFILVDFCGFAWLRRSMNSIHAVRDIACPLCARGSDREDGE